MSEPTSVRLGGENLDSIHIDKKNLFPEGVEYVPSLQQFLITSFGEGTIFAVNKEGKLTPFAEDERLVSTVGIEIDPKRNRFLVANSDLGQAVNSSSETENQLAALGIFDLTTGETIDYINLGELRPDKPHFANDTAVDDFGNVYVTDSFAGIIYKVDTEGNPSVFFENERFVEDGFNLNGIVVHPDDFLLVGDYNDGEIFKVPLDHPEQFTQVDIDQKLINSDGFLLVDEDELVVVVNDVDDESANAVVALHSDDNWESAQIADELEVDAELITTATIKDGEIFAVDSAINELFDEQLAFDDFKILEVGSIKNGYKDDFGDFSYNLNFDFNLNFGELFDQGREIFSDLQFNLESDIFTDSFSINFGTSFDSTGYEDFFNRIDKSLSEVESFIIKESDNITI